jgi:O-methyltransferase
MAMEIYDRVSKGDVQVAEVLQASRLSLAPCPTKLSAIHPSRACPTKKAIFTLNIENYAPEITELTYPLIQRYAEKIGASFYTIQSRQFPGFPPVYEKLQIYNLARDIEAEWIFYIDSDTLVHPDLFDITDHLPPHTVLHNGSDLAGNRFREDDYFHRDGRHIGSCNWFAVAPRTCLDLWHPLEDITLQEAVENIYPTAAEELSGVIERDHLIDDYTLSRNIARYGLKFVSLIEILTKRPERTPDGRLPEYLWHIYDVSKDEKIRQMKWKLRMWGIPMLDDPTFRAAFRFAIKHGLLQSPSRGYTLWEVAQKCAHLDGEFWECGVFKGASAYIIQEAVANALQENFCKWPTLRLFDTFAGLPNAGTDTGRFAASMEHAQQLLESYPGRVEFLCGTVPETFQGLGQAKIAFAHLDLDLYPGTLAAMNFIWPRLVPGGFMVIDDYKTGEWPGVDQAVADFAKDHDFGIEDRAGQALIRK